MSVPRRAIGLARAAVLGQALFVAGWVAAGLLQSARYSPTRHDISDLAALTARVPWVMLLAQGAAGALTIAFALGALRPMFQAPGRRGSAGPWLVAFSLAGWDNLSDAFFRLDCMAADPGCISAVATASFPGRMHLLAAIATALITLLAPFVIARHMRALEGWRDLAPASVAFGVVFAALFAAYLALTGHEGHGTLQRVMTALVAGGVVMLARRVIAIAAASLPPTPSARRPR